jgi:hypothetical protein
LSTLNANQILIGNASTSLLQSPNLTWNNTSNTLSVTNFIGSGNALIGTTTNNGSTLNITASTTGDRGTNNGSNSVVYIRQTGGWNGNQQWALYVSGYSYLNGFRINANDGIRSLYKTAAGGSLGFATAGNDPITFTQNDVIERMRVAAGGNVGIGTTSPQRRLHAINSIMLSSGSAAQEFLIGDDNVRYFSLQTPAGAANLQFNVYGGSNIMTMTSGGSVGIGKIAPNAVLDVNGNAIITGSITATAGGFDSDLTLKDIVTRDLTQYRIADSVSPIIYTWKDTSKGTLQRFGYGAQELLPLIPEAVYQNGSGSTYAVDYTQVHTVLIDENTKRIQALERELAELKQIINALVNNK